MEQDNSPTMPAKTEDAYARMLRRSLEEHALKKNIFATMMRAANPRQPETTVLDSHLKLDQCLKVMWNLDCASDHDGSLGPKRITSAQVSTIIMDNVFGIAELAEKIFLECRIQDLLVNCQRVCKQWQAIITSSKRLQQALFFEPLGGYQIDSWPNDEASGADSYFGDWLFFSAPEDLPAESERRWAEHERTLVFANPFLDQIFRKGQVYHAPPGYVANANADYEERRKRMSRVGPSWWRMLACQPPLEQIHFPQLEDTGNELEIIRDGGVQIVDTICIEPGYQTTPQAFDAMTPVTFAKEVRRVDYKKGELKFEKCELELW